MHPKEKLPKLKLASDIEETAHKILGKCIHGDENILEFTDNIYAMGKPIAIKSGIVLKETNSHRKINPEMGTGEREK